MVNEVVLVGKLKGVKERDEFKKSLFIEIERPFKNTYNRINDVIECVFWDSLFKRIVSGCKSGDMIAIRGRIENEENKCHVAIENIVLLNKSRDNILKVS